MSVGTVELAPGYAISRLIRGGWQLGRGRSADPLDDLAAFARAGITTFEVSDTYAGAEALLGRFLAEAPTRLGAETARRIKVHTRYTASLGTEAPSRAGVTASIDRSLQRLGAERLDLLQLQWWDFARPGLLEVAGWLVDLAEDGKVDRLGVTNFGIAPLKRLLAAGLPIISNQIQFSLVDRRARNGLAEVCRSAGIALLAYGTLAGGFLTERWLGRPDPLAGGDAALDTPEYRFLIDEAGGWDAHQELLHALREIAAVHRASVVTVALSWVLDQPGVAAALVGASSAKRLPGLLAACETHLTEKDHATISRATARLRGPTGDVGELEREAGHPLSRQIRSRLQTHVDPAGQG